MRLADLALRLLGSTSGETIVRSAAAASGAITLPAGTTDFSATSGVVQQASAGAPFTAGTVAVANGGTGATTAATARTNLGAVNIAGDTMTGALTAPAVIAELTIHDRTTPAHSWTVYSTSDQLEIFSSVANNNVLVANTGGSIWPAANNIASCGLGGLAWNSVNSYVYNTISDAGLKTDVEALPDDCLALIDALAAKRYRIGGQASWGFIAQDVAEALGEDFPGHVTDADSGIQGLRYNDLVAVLWKAVQELSAKVDALEGREPAA